MANGMAALYVGASGLKTAQTSINTAAHNLSNINTTGYTRQQVTQSDTQYLSVGYSAKSILQSGLGVTVSEIRRVRDEFLDSAYREEAGRTSFYESQLEAVEEIETLFDEMNGTTLSSCLEDLWSAINEVAKNPGSTVTRTELVESAVAFLDRATYIYDGLIDYQKMLNTKISDTVDRINELGSTIKSLNDEINRIENSGENAMDLCDQRDAALDELASLVKISYEEDANGKINVYIENTPFLVGNTLYTMGTRTIEGSNLLIPTWTQLGDKDVFYLNEEFNSTNNNDIGELKGLLLARGSIAAVSYQDVPVEPDASDYETDAEYEAAYAQYKLDVKEYNNNIDNSVILSTIAGLDKLINGIVEAINDVLCPETTTDADIYDKDGNLVASAGDTILDLSATSYGMDGTTVGVELFSRTYTDRYNVYELADGSCVYVRNDVNSFGYESLYTLGNIEVNDTVLQDCQTIPLSLENGGEDIEKAEELLAIWDVEFAALNPSKYAKEDFMSFYNSLVSSIANTGEVFTNMVSYQQSMTDEIDNRRQGLTGVSSDEELTNLIRYQSAYNASSRYINVVNEMLEHLVTSLGS